MKIAVAQINSELGNKEANLKKIANLCSNASENRADIILFPEMSVTGYNMEIIKDIASSKNDETYQAISNIAKDSKIHIAIGIEDRRGENLFNTLTVFDNGGEIISQYDKTHLYTGEPVKEQEYLSFGDHISILKINEFTAGLQICYDIRFPELSRTMTLQGANLLLISAAWPEVRKEHWISLLKARAIENQCYIAAANRCGKDKMLHFAGSSMIISPTGEIINELNIENDDVIISDLDIDLVEKTRDALTVFKDRREDIYK